MYDPALGRWHSIDPVTEEHFNYTPYHYTFNSPINFIDVLGMDTTWFNKIDGGIEIHHQDDKGNEESYILLLDEDNKKEEKKKKKKKNRDDDTYWTKGGVRYTWELGGYYGNNENHRAMYFRTTNIDGIFGGAWDLAGKAANLLYRNAKILPQTGEKDKNIKKENSGSVEDKTDNTGKSIKARIRNAQNNSKLDTTYEIYKGNRPYRIAVCTVRGFRRRVLIPRHKYKLKPTTKNAGSPPAWCIQHVACWHLFQHITCTSSSSFFFFQYVFAY